MFSVTDFLSLAGSVFALLSMGSYVVLLLRGATTPNPASWIIWLVIGVINTVTYLSTVEGDWSRAGVLIIVTTGILLVTVYSLVRGRFSRLGRLEISVLALALAVGTFWQMTGNAILANLVLQMVYVISFVPTVIGLRNGSIKEHPGPWALSVFAYVAMIASVFVNWETNHWVALAHPILNGLLGNGMVVFYALKLPRQRVPRPSTNPRYVFRSGTRFHPASLSSRE